MYELLQTLLLDLDRLNDAEAVVLVHGEYGKLCAGTAIQTHDGQRVVFHERQFGHAFFTSCSWSTRPTDKSIFCRFRGARVRWIEPLINGRIEQSDCWEFPPSGGPSRRLYVLWPERYMVWLYAMAKTPGWNFSTGYIAANHAKIREITRGKGKRIWWHKKGP